ncbi:tRNA pseudouridine(38-40) synthase TruA [Paenibacillus xerothermodurans]|uniref:tRNA pseudouridine synthase A n=1 Tax=Paenibacillus xerothermodurans TaxID=1977292 RepID=A0A2W1N659_PAEXE|nr:tRNA pseudouridine(38-40) synthase TruA [Paenibacillus xerothermodurans]PZE19110.1 tRNA pseudouridine(38-40) synthase TruA [Paenibacillus xerothermodurans]
MRNIRMTVSYDGTSYSGFQTQPIKNTVQDVLEGALLSLTGETIKITSSGRTDAGVHSRGQVINFHTASKIPVHRWCLALNSLLPPDIVVSNAQEVADTFHARRSAVQKTYRYTIRCGRHPDLFKRHYEFHHPTPLNTDAMQAGLQWLLGRHDFTSFCSVRSTKLSNIRTILKARLECEPLDPLLNSYAIHIYVTGNGFLYNMVRIIVGTLLQVGEGKRTSDSIKEILEAQNRAKAGPTAMAHGLTLWEVVYDQATN